MKEFCLAEIAKRCGGKLNEQRYSDIKANGAVSDSNSDLAGKIFIPIRGERVNGHDFIEKAFENGAAVSFCDEDRTFGKPVIYVKDNQKALQKLAGYYRNLFSLPIIGITGSVGKTTVKDMTASVLSQRFKTLKTRGNLNTGIGLPIMLLELEDCHEIAVIEMGMRNFGEIRELTMLARPETAVITNIGISHIELLKSRDGIFQAKLEILEGLEGKQNKIFWHDDDKLASLSDKLQDVYWFGTENDNFFYPENIKYNGLDGTNFTLCHKDDKIEVNIPLPGEHLVTSALCAACAGKVYGLTLDEIKKGIEDYIPSGSRMQISKFGGITCIDDTYNASPASMKSALDVLNLAGGRKIAVLGDMLELGENSVKAHIEVGQYASAHADILMTFGTRALGIASGYSEKAAQKALCFDTKDELACYLKNVLQSGDCVLFKASRSLEFETIVKSIRS